MSAPETAFAPRGPGKLRLVIAFLAGGLLAFALLGLVVANYTSQGLMGFLRSAIAGEKTINVSQPAVVRQIQQLERLETVAYTMEKLVWGERDNPYIPKFLIGDKLVLVVHGDVVAGVDLRNVSATDVNIQGRTITVRLPEAELFSTRVDNEKTMVYSRVTGLLSRPDPHFETEIRREAERQLKQAALKDGILETANQNARATMSSLLKGFGFQQVEIR
ncbi:MAG: DUF4230 domain-containing protein [Acidobacteriales bacterium]|nr:DUF4230 domain-containing protein [Terriglobales bacterium]